MVWDYRVFKNTHVYPNGATEETFDIHEVYYNDNGDICAATEDSIEPMGETLEELKQDLEWMLEALEQPVLEEDKIEYKPWDPDSNGEEAIYDGPFISLEDIDWDEEILALENLGEDDTFSSGEYQSSEESTNDRAS